MWIIVFILPLISVASNELTDKTLLSNRVLGTVATVCGQIPYHTHPDSPYPMKEVNQSWIPGIESQCLHDADEVLHYCRQLYSDSVQRAIPNPFVLAERNFPPYSPNLLVSMQIYLCLGSPSSSPSSVVSIPAHMETTIAPARHLPSLMDIHRAYFEDKFRQLSNQTKANVTKLIEQLRSGSEGLAKLQKSDPRLAQYSASHMLQDAHKRLEQIWTQEASEWSRLEQKRHMDLVKQLDSEDWAGENEFAYVLQEFTLDLDRVQDALSNLLNRLADSVDEEVRHLRLIRTHQPWELASNHTTNWTNHITHEVTNIERVHAVLLKHVSTATKAINTVRSLMIKNTPTTGPLRPYLAYKPSVLASYNRLQSELFSAESALSEAKQILVTNVTDKMHSLFQHMHQLSTENQSITDAYVMDWLRSTHHSELAFIDLLVSRILDHPVSVGDFGGSSVWMPAQDTTPRIASQDSLAVGDSPLAKLTLHTALILAAVALVCLVVIMSLLMLCLLVRSRRHALFASGTHRLKHFARRTGLFGNREAVYTPTWKVERRVVVVSSPEGPASTAIATADNQTAAPKPSRGYANPIHQSC